MDRRWQKTLTKKRQHPVTAGLTEANASSIVTPPDRPSTRMSCALSKISHETDRHGKRAEILLRPFGSTLERLFGLRLLLLLFPILGIAGFLAEWAVHADSPTRSTPARWPPEPSGRSSGKRPTWEPTRNWPRSSGSRSKVVKR